VSTERVQTKRDWFQLVALVGCAGRRWVEEYRSGERLEIMQETFRTLGLLRMCRLEEGKNLLDSIENRLERAATGSVSFLRVLERHYYPVLAYYHYCAENFDEAERLLALSESAVQEILEAEPFLLPFADSCLDFAFQRVRIARNRRWWTEMQWHLSIVQGMMEDRLPLCRLRNETAVHLSTLRTFYGSLPLGATERASLSNLLDPESCSRTFHRITAEICVLPGFVIPYP
jgi:hypothetical protein